MKLPRPQRTLREYLSQYEKEHTKLGTKLTHMVGIPMIVASIPTAFVNPPVAGGLFVGGWALQYVGHYVFEKNKPAFYGDPYYLLVGPIWVAAEWIRVFGLPLPDGLSGAARQGQGTAEVKTANGEAVPTAI
ncbi:MAG: DUF962 domain-containing protein [Myxococcota bacterium]|nr:DUF962 domain-containing protein [Myxococcota bacterium]